MTSLLAGRSRAAPLPRGGVTGSGATVDLTATKLGADGAPLADVTTTSRIGHGTLTLGPFRAMAAGAPVAMAGEAEGGGGLLGLGGAFLPAAIHLRRRDQRDYGDLCIFRVARALTCHDH